MKQPVRNNWILALLLTVPLFLFFLNYLFHHAPGLIPTGFIQYDNVSYIAYARQYLDASSFSLFYSNPFDIDAPKIYFQPHILFFAALMAIGIPPGWILIPFTLVSSLICFRLIIALYDHLIKGQKFRILQIWLFAWGGGLLCITGIIRGMFVDTEQPFLANMFALDPDGGWWGLNLGRALLFSCEAYYHALFLGAIYCLLSNRWLFCLGLLALLSLSHPFTGIELLGIVCLWAAIELLVNIREIPKWFVAGSFILLTFHIWYYLFFLEQFAHHQSVREQYSLSWVLRYYRILPAFAIVGCFTLASIYIKGVKSYFSIRNNRLFACWFMVAFLLSNHQWFMEARQPIHFTRGYIWTSLFLMGLPAINRFCTTLRVRWGNAALIAFAAMFLLDNALWFGLRIWFGENDKGAEYIVKSEEEVLQNIRNESTTRTIVLGNDNDIAYLSSVYSAATPWYAHPFTTPFASGKREIQTRFLLTGIPDSSWTHLHLLLVLNKSEDRIFSVSDHLINPPPGGSRIKIPFKKTFSNIDYSILNYQSQKR